MFLAAMDEMFCEIFYQSPLAMICTDLQLRATKRQIVTIGDEEVAPCLTERVLKFVHALPQGATGLLLFAPAPQQGGELRAKHRPRAGHRQNRQQSACFSRPRQVAPAVRILHRKVAEQTQAQPSRMIGSCLGVLGAGGLPTDGDTLFSRRGITWRFHDLQVCNDPPSIECCDGQQYIRP